MSLEGCDVGLPVMSACFEKMQEGRGRCKAVICEKGHQWRKNKNRRRLLPSSGGKEA